MVEVGTVSIGGSIDTSMIDRGLKRIQTGFGRVADISKSVHSDMQRIGSVAAGLAKSFGLLALTGAGAMLGLAKTAPAVAPAMGKIKVAMTKLAIEAGEALAPAFEKVAELLNRFADWASAHPNLFQMFTLSAAAVTGWAVIKSVFGFLSTVKIAGTVLSFLAYLANPAVLAAIAALAGLYGLQKLDEAATAGQRAKESEAASYGASAEVAKAYAGIGAPGATYQGTLPVLPSDLEMAQRNQEENRRFFLMQWWDAIFG